jgi:hypothetical protein
MHVISVNAANANLCFCSDNSDNGPFRDQCLHDYQQMHRHAAQGSVGREHRIVVDYSSAVQWSLVVKHQPKTD